jgi:hypothetical protein
MFRKFYIILIVDVSWFSFCILSIYACLYYTKNIYPQEINFCVHFALIPRVSVSDATCKVTQGVYCCSWKYENGQYEDVNIGYNAQVQHFERLSCYLKPVFFCHSSLVRVDSEIIERSSE